MTTLGFPLKFCIVAGFLALGGCSAVGPEYRAPTLSDADVPTRWASLPAAENPKASSTLELPEWWRQLDDATLDSLVEATLASSPTLDAATARLSQARASRLQTESYGYPAANLSATATRSDTSSTGTAPQEQASGSLNVGWELDLAGARTRALEAAAAREEVQVATLSDVRGNLAAELVDGYVAYRACQSALALNKQDLASRVATAKLTAASVEVGLSAPYQGARSAASVAEAQAQRSALSSQCGQLENRLTRITGIPRSELSARLTRSDSGLPTLPAPRAADIHLPVEALALRPDLRAAERALSAASADIGLALADRYPRLSLTGSTGYAAKSSGAGTVTVGIWSFGPSLTLPLLDGGRRAAAVTAARARYDEAFALYRTRARQAVQEIEDGLTRYAAATERMTAAKEAVLHYERYFRTVTLRYQEGASNLIELEDARRVWLIAEQTLLSVRQEQLQAWVYLHRATGGAARYSQPELEQPNG